MTQPFIKITSEGIQFFNEPPKENPKFFDDPTEIISGVKKDTTLVLYGKNFVVEHELTTDDALSLIAIIGYQLREKLYVPHPTRKTS